MDKPDCVMAAICHEELKSSCWKTFLYIRLATAALAVFGD